VIEQKTPGSIGGGIGLADEGAGGGRCPSEAMANREELGGEASPRRG
jgi:hypothetical protein